MPHYGFTDASMTNGLTFQLGLRRKGGLFGFFDSPPPRDGSSIEPSHIRNRKRWKRGASVTQISWSGHGRVAIVETAKGVRLAVWCTELEADPQQSDKRHAQAMQA